jgi:signal transduction histidine kinase/ligand-binding sensor domain-containing protein
MRNITHLSQLVRTILLAGACIFAAALSKAQQVFEQTDHSLSGQYHKGWTIREGVPGSIWDIAQDNDGFIWLGTASGLYRFDGVSFERFTPPKGQQLVGGPEAPILSLLAPREGGLWVGYQFGGASFIKGRTITNYPPRSILSHSMNNMAEDATGNIWAKTPFGFVRFDGTRWSTIGQNWGLPQGSPFYFHGDSAGDIWASMADKFFLLRPGAKKFEDTGLKYGSLSVQRDQNGRVWCEYGKNQLYELRPGVDGNWTVERTAFQQKLLDFTITQDNSFWIAADGQGISRIRGPVPFLQKSLPALRFETFRHADGLTDDLVFRVMQDKEGGIWTLSTKGLDYFRPTILNTVSLDSKMKNITMASAGDVLMVASSYNATAPMMRLSHDQMEAWHGSPPKVRNITAAPDKTTWISDGKEIWHNVDNRFIRISPPKEFAAPQYSVHSMVAGQSGDLWISVIGDIPYHLFHLASDGWHGFNKSPNPLNPAAVELMRDHEGQIWFGFKDNAIVVTGPHGDRAYSGESGLDVGIVAEMREKANHVWVGGSDGLDYFSNGHFQQIYSESGDHIHGISGIIETGNGDLWINSTDGILRILASDLQNALHSAQHRAHARLFDYLDGAIGTPELHHPPSIAQTTDGRIYFQSRDDIVWVDPNHIESNALAPKVFVTSTTADGHKTTDPNILELEKGTQNLEVDYTATSLLIPERDRFRYKLEGFDRDWQIAGTRRQAFYSKLPPGHFIFRVLASNNDGVWSTQPAEVVINLPPTFLESVWFKVLCCIILILLLISFYLIRVTQISQRIKRSLLDRLAERERISRDLHDTFFQSIQGLLLRVNTATGQLNEDEPARPLLLDALEESDRVMLMGRELVLDLRSSISYEEELSEAFAEAGEEFKLYGSAESSVIVLGQSRPLHPLVAREIYVLGREALCNAFRHARAEKIETELNFGKEAFGLNIRDDGIGIEEDILSEGKPGHMGLSGMLERATKIDAKLTVWSNKGVGTEISLSVPSKVAYIQKSQKLVWYQRWIVQRWFSIARKTDEIS